MPQRLISVHQLTCFLLLFLLCCCCSAVEPPKPRQIKALRVVLAGSYHRHIDIICKIRRELEKAGVVVLEPLCGNTVNKGGDFIVLENDNPKVLNDETYRRIQHRFMDHCKEADIIYVYNEDGYIGLSTAFEVGLSRGHGKRIICHQLPKDKGLQVSDFGEVMPYPEFLQYCRKAITP